MPSGWHRKFQRKPGTEVGQGSGIVVEKALFVSTSSDGSQSTDKANGKSKLSSTKPSTLGLNLLVEGDNPTVDIIAVHGLNGSSETTWTAKNNVKWLQDEKMLPARIPNARIYSWGYDANTHSMKSLTAMYLYDHAQKLVSDLSLERRLTKTERRPIIFIAHSLGGIVVKSALIHASMAHHGHLKDHKAIKTSTYGIIFMATPHQGGKGVTLGQLLINAASIAMHTNDNLLKFLAKDSEALQSQLAQYAPISSDFVTKFAYETYPMRIAKLGEMIVVPKSSAVVPGVVDAEAIAVMADHESIVKFSSENDDGFRKISGHVMLMVEDAPDKVARNWEQEIALQNAVFGTMKPEFHVPFDMKGIPRTSAFVGRESYLNTMMLQLSPASAARRRRVCVLHGLGGIGKTQLAIEYARLQKNVYSSFFWIDGKTEESLIQSLVSIVSRIPEAEIPGFDREEVGGIEDSKKKAKEILQWFALEDNGAWLLVYDNVDQTSYGASDVDTESQACYNIEEYLPGGDAGTIIITTRLQRLTKLGSQAHIRKLDFMSGVTILENQSGKSFRCSSHLEGGGEGKKGVEVIDPDALTLVERLEGLPLALVLAGSYISRTTISKYLDLYAKSWDSLHQNLSFAPDYPGRTVITTWKVSYDELKRKNEGATKLLQLWGYIDNRDVWYELFRWQLSWEEAPTWLHQIADKEVDFLGTIQLLLDYSLIEQNGHEESYSMHPVVHDWIREVVNRDDDDGKILQTAVATVGLRSLDVTEEKDLTLGRQHLPHAIRISQASFEKDRFSHYPYNKGGNAYIRGLLNTGCNCYGFYRYAEAEVLFRRLLALIRSKEGAVVDDARRFYATQSLALCLQERHKSVEAETLFRQLLTEKERAIGEDDISTLETVANLGRLCEFECRDAEAEKFYMRAFEGNQKILGPYHKATLFLMSNLGMLFARHSRYAEAEAMLRRALEGQESMLGVEHSLTLQTVHYLGQMCCFQEKFDQAESLLQRALDGREKLFGKDDRMTLSTVLGLGIVYGDQDKFDDAERAYQRLLTFYEGEPGEGTHGHMLDNLAEYGFLYNKQEKFEAAQTVFAKALELSKGKYGEHHKHTINDLYGFGSIYFGLDKLDDAEKSWREAAKVGEEMFGTEHHLTLSALSALGNLYIYQKRYEEAEAAYQRCVTGSEKVYGKEHPVTFLRSSQLGSCYASMGKNSDAEDIYQRTLERMERVLGKEHKSTLDLVHKMGSFYADQEKQEQAEVAYTRALSGREIVLGEEHPSTLDVVHDLGVLFLAQGRNKEGEDMLNRAWTVRDKVLGIEHCDTRESLYLICDHYNSQPWYIEYKASKSSQISSRSPFNPFSWKRRIPWKIHKPLP